MKYFSPAFFKFFDELKNNNNKEWFDKNKSRYENDVKAPFKKLVEDVSRKLAKDIPNINTDASKAIFRINRDVRFSKDKSPYKLNVAAVLSPGGKKEENYPGFYMHFGADEIMVGGGKYFCTKEDIAKIRQEIYYNNKEFTKLLSDKAFKEKWKTLQGDKSKILPPEYKDFIKEQPLIANKQFWYYANLTRKDVTGDKLDDLVLSYYRAALKINRFLLETITG